MKIDLGFFHLCWRLYQSSKLFISSIEFLRNNIISKLLTISDKEYLSELYDVLVKSNNVSEFVKWSKEQISMRKMSDNDIIKCNVFSQEQIDKEDSERLKGR